MSPARVLAVLALLASSCRRYQPAAPWSPPDEPEDGAIARDAHSTIDRDSSARSQDGSRSDAGPSPGASATTTARRCVSHALPPEDLGATPTDDGGVAIAFSGRSWGVAWTEHVDDSDAVYFVSVGENGRRMDTPVRVTEPGYRGRHPALAWTGEQWMIVSSSGSARYDELWVQRLSERGQPVSRPRRITGRDRNDRFPALAPAASGGFLLAWAAEIEPRKHEIMAVRLGMWGQQLAPPMSLAERTSALSSVTVTPRDDEFVVSWSALRPTTFAIEAVRVEPISQQTAGVARVVSAPNGLADRAPRAAAVNTASRLTFAWEQWEHGVSGVRIAHYGRRLSGDAPSIAVDDPGSVLHAPALATLDDQTLVLAAERSVGELDSAVVVSTRTIDDQPLGPWIRMRGHEGVAQRPRLSIGSRAVAVLTRGPRGLALHRVPLVECGAERDEIH